MRGQNSAEHSLGNIGPNIYILIKNLEGQNDFRDNSNGILEIQKIKKRDEWLWGLLVAPEITMFACSIVLTYKTGFLNAVFLLLKTINITRLLLDELSWMVENI